DQPNGKNGAGVAKPGDVARTTQPSMRFGLGVEPRDGGLFPIGKDRIQNPAGSRIPWGRADGHSAARIEHFSGASPNKSFRRPDALERDDLASNSSGSLCYLAIAAGRGQSRSQLM